MSVEQILNHEEEALARLLEQYRGKEGIEGLLSALVAPLQDLETAFIDLRDKRGLNDNVGGAVLDMLGTIVGAERSTGETDEEYLTAIKIKIGQNHSTATPEDIIALFGVLVPDVSCWLVEQYPATVGIFTDGEPADSETVKAAIDAALGAGVRLDYLVSYDGENTFAFDGGDGIGGFGDLDFPGEGGLFAELI